MRRHRHGLRRRHGHARKGKGQVPLRVLERRLAKLHRVVKARGGRTP